MRNVFISYFFFYFNFINKIAEATAQNYSYLWSMLVLFLKKLNCFIKLLQNFLSHKRQLNGKYSFCYLINITIKHKRKTMRNILRINSFLIPSLKTNLYMNLHEYQAKELLKKYNVPVQ